MREPGEDDPDDGVIPYDPAWWADFSRRCNELTPEDIEGMAPVPEEPCGLGEEMVAESLEEIFTRMRAKRAVQEVTVKVVELRAGLHRIEGVRCGCGGELRVEKFGTPLEYLWETFCVKCETCNPNGYQTLTASVESAKEFFSKPLGE